jgi:hypothetical protein
MAAGAIRNSFQDVKDQSLPSGFGLPKPGRTDQENISIRSVPKRLHKTKNNKSKFCFYKNI